MKSFLVSLISVYSYSILIIISSLLERTNGVPDDYCFAPLNKSDCGKPATAVFTYWHPGSRCEIEFWRGCPTTNKFPNEYVCSHYCIAALLKPEFSDYEDWGPLKKKGIENLCDEEFNGDDCKGDSVEVYTYNKTSGMCVKVTWRGCESINRFEDEEDCIEVCQGNFTAELSKLKVQDIENVIDVLNNSTDTSEEKEETTTDAPTETDATEAEAIEADTTEAETTEAETTEPEATEAATTEDTEDPEGIVSTL